jgi:predicted RNA-binding protein with RPS1 domain
MRFIQIIIILEVIYVSRAFSPIKSRLSKQNSKLLRAHTSSSVQENVSVEDDRGKEVPSCFWKTPDGMCRTSDGTFRPVEGKWEQRLQLKDLKVGQQLIGKKISNADLLQANTGPKIFYDCGIGRISAKGQWQMVSGMFRVAKSYAKASVVRKKVARLSGKPVELYVHKIHLDNGRLEVKLSFEDSENELKNEISRVSASSLKEGQELVGKIVQLKPYGCLVDVGANRNGLLHIQRVADLFEKYIDKEKGLEEAGLPMGASIKVAVKSNERKRLFLDFTQETKDLSEEEKKRVAEEEEANNKEAEEAEMAESAAAFGFDATTIEEEANVVPEDEAAQWAIYADDFGIDDDEYDEDSDIEDSLGIGSY